MNEDIQMIYDDYKEPEEGRQYKQQQKQQIKLKDAVYTIYYNDKTQNQYFVSTKVCSEMKVRDFLHVIIKEYNDYFKQEDIPIYFFPPDEFTTYELYMCDEEYNPDEEYPAFDETQALFKTNTDQFALKVTRSQIDLMISALDDKQSPQTYSPPNEQQDKIPATQFQHYSIQRDSILQRVNFNPSLNFLYFHVVNMMMIIYDLIKYKILVDTNQESQQPTGLIHIRSTQQQKQKKKCINLIKNVLDSKVQKNLDVLIQSGLPSILLEVVFKQGLIDDQQRFEAFTYYRELFESEYTFKEMKEETALETYKLIKILPGPIYDLFTDDGEEQLIFNQLNEIKSSPILVWSEEVRKEILLTYVTYTNHVIKQIEHRRVNQLALPQLANEVLVQDIILMNFNKQPTWYFEEGLISFMSELCDQIDQSIKRFYKATNQRYINRLLTQFTSFMLALEQYFMNTNHPEFVEELSLLEEYDQDKLERIIEKQRDTISVSIVKYIYNWFKLFKENKDITLAQMRSLMIQILYLLFHSEVAIIIMDESDEFFIYFMIEYLLDIIRSKSTDGEKQLCLHTINKLIEHKLVYQKISNPNFMQLYELCLLCENKQMELIFKNIMASIQNETNKSIEFSQFLLDSNINIKKKHHLDMIQSNQTVQLESIWRTNYDDPNFILMEEEKSQFPQVPREAIEQLPDMPFGLFHKLENIQQLYEDYVKLLRFGNIVEFQYQPDLKEVKEQTRESLVIRQTQVLLVDDDEIFS